MNILERMSQISMMLKALEKDIKVDVPNGDNYKAISDLAVTNAVKDAESKWGVYSYPHDGTFHEQMIDCTSGQGRPYKKNMIRYDVLYRFACVDNPKDYVDVPSCGVGIDEGDKAPGKAMTTSRKYAYLQGYRIPTTDLDVDRQASTPTIVGNAMVQKVSVQSVPAPAAVQPTQRSAAPVKDAVEEPKSEAKELVEDDSLPFVMEEKKAPIAEPVVVEQPSDPEQMTEEMARAFVVESGMYKGKTLGEVLLSDPSYISFAVNKMRRNERNMAVIRACEVLEKLIA